MNCFDKELDLGCWSNRRSTSDNGYIISTIHPCYNQFYEFFERRIKLSLSGSRRDKYAKFLNCKTKY